MDTDIRTVADAILYEGYLLYPYRSTSLKNRSRWQFGVLGPSDAYDAGIGEDSTMSTQCLVETRPDASVDVTVRCLQLQDRRVERRDGDSFVPVDDLDVDGMHWLTWDEAVEVELDFDRLALSDIGNGMVISIDVDGDVSTEPLGDAGRIVRSRHRLIGEVTLSGENDGPYTRIGVCVRNTGTPEPDRESAMRASFIGTHLVLHADCTEFSSLLEPSEQAVDSAANCVQHRCFPVLAGKPGTYDSVLVSPIILYDYPEIAEQSEGSLFDSTEIDEILTLRVMTMTEVEKAEARATDPRAAAIIDRCDETTTSALQSLHGEARLVPEIPDGSPWWSPEADTAVDPQTDAVLVQGVPVRKDTLVRVRPTRRADAQDLFLDGRIARVATVHEDVDGGTHVAVVMLDDPAAELHSWYGRYLYFAPDELEPLHGGEGKETWT